MKGRYNQQPRVGDATRFVKSPMADIEYSRMVADPTWLLPFNAGDIVPVYYAEVLPHDTYSLDLDFVIRQNTVLRPTMGKMQVDFHAFFVPTRIVNDSWKNVQGENTSGFWSAPEVDLAPLWSHPEQSLQIEVGSIADYYGFPTQNEIDGTVLSQCNDTKFRGYLEIYNNYYRDQNYQPPIPYSKLNVYNGFLEPFGSFVGLNGVIDGGNGSYVLDSADGSYPNGALTKALYGEGGKAPDGFTSASIPFRLTSFSANDKPLKANKLHDAFTSALPAPQKGTDVYFGVGNTAPVSILASADTAYPLGNGLRFQLTGDETASGGITDAVQIMATGRQNLNEKSRLVYGNPSTGPDYGEAKQITGTNLYGVADLQEATGITVNDLRIAVATQQVYETLARGGSRYTSVLRNFFGLETESPYPDIPIHLGHIRRDLDLYQVAQTSSSDSESPQGNLTAFGYTTNGGHLFTRTFLEHGYIHVFATVRQRNVYSTYLAPDNFRRGTLDFYLPQFANIGEQPIPLAVLQPFANNRDVNPMESVLGYQEAFWDYRYEPDRVHGLFRSGVDQSLNVWTYADDYDSTFRNVSGDWLKSNAEEVMNRTLAVTSAVAPQLKGLFHYRVDKQRPMPTYSVPGLDII